MDEAIKKELDEIRVRLESLEREVTLRRVGA